jgi:hypothetical protein
LAKWETAFLLEILKRVLTPKMPKSFPTYLAARSPF